MSSFEKCEYQSLDGQHAVSQKQGCQGTQASAFWSQAKALGIGYLADL